MPEKGKLTVLFGNLAAFARWDPANPEASRYVDEDFNRIWADDYLHSSRTSVEIERGRLIQPFVDAADFVLDIHSMREPCAALMVCGTTGRGADKAVAMSMRMGVPKYLMFDTGHPAGLRMIERGDFADPKSPKVALLIECGQHWEKTSADVAKETLLRFLRETGTLSPKTVAPHLNPALVCHDHQVIEVTEAVVAKSTEFRFEKPYCGLEVIEKKGDPIAYNGDEIVRAPYDNTVLIMPAVAKQWKIGTTMVRFGRLIKAS